MASGVNYVDNIRTSGLTIYDKIEIGDHNLWVPTRDLERLLDSGLRGMSLSGLPLRTRSKVVKERICQVLGYPVPKSFKKTQPRFPGQLFDIYVQKSNNLQVWNEELSSTRRYVLIRVSDDGIVNRVKVVTGGTLSLLDTTHTLTQKYQARCIPRDQTTELVSNVDTRTLSPFVCGVSTFPQDTTPESYPKRGQLLPITDLFQRLSGLVGTAFEDSGSDQERNRGAVLHKLVCSSLGYGVYKDSGQFPDLPHQLLEVKLQTSPTIDLGLVRPDSTDVLDFPKMNKTQIRHCDVRYAIFCADIGHGQVRLTHLFLTTGEDFFSRFSQFQGKVLNKKLQIPLPSDFFDT